MDLQITGKNMEIQPTVRSYITRKLGKLNRHLPNILECKVELTEEKTKAPGQHFVAQVTVNSKGILLRGEERGEDLLQAVDKVAAVMDRQIERYKGKQFNKGRGNSWARGGLAPEAEAAEPQPKVVKVKQFAMKPMPMDEAIHQMELLGHNFFLFYNVDSKGLNLLYRRRDGNYGLIEPEAE